MFIASAAFLLHFIVKMHAEALRISAKKKLRKIFNLLTCWRKDYDKFTKGEKESRVVENDYPILYSRRGTFYNTRGSVFDNFKSKLTD